MTNADFVSRVINGLQAISKDDHISKRYILKIGQNKSKFYISQKLLDKSLFKEDNIFRHLNCFQLRSEDVIKCGIYEFSRCDSLMKSHKKIPGLIFSRYGASILTVSSIDDGVLFQPTTLAAYSNFKQRSGSSKFKSRSNFYYIKEGYLYIPDSEVKAVNIVYIPDSEEGLSDASECSENTCKSMWDLEFIVPDKLSEQVISETINEVLTSKKIQPDENPNLNQNIK